VPWVNEQRDRHSKVWEDDQIPGRKWISSSMVPLHHESVLDSGNFDTENDFMLNPVNNSRLNGYLMNRNGFHVTVQTTPARGAQSPQGTLSFGGRKGQHWISLRPESLGYFDWDSRVYTDISNAPDFGDLNTEIHTADFAKGGPNIRLNRGFTGTWSNVWTTPGGGAVDWIFNANSIELKQDLIINQAARDYYQAQGNDGYFGVRYELTWRDIPRVLADRIERNTQDDDFEGDFVELEDADLNRLGVILPGAIYVRNRGGRVRVRKRLYKEQGTWYLFLGALSSEIANLLPGDLIIDPPITTEAVGINSDDAHENNIGAIGLSGYANRLYMGDYSSGNNSNMQSGFRFQTVPIDNAATVNSASVTLYRTGLSGTPELRVHCQDADNAGTFTTTTNDISGRAVTTGVLWNTTTTPNLGTGNNQDITSTDLASDVQTVVNRAGWASNNSLVVIIRDVNTAGFDYLTVEDFNSANTNEARFDADVDAASGAALVVGNLHRNQFKHILVR